MPQLESTWDSTVDCAETGHGTQLPRSSSIATGASPSAASSSISNPPGELFAAFSGKCDPTLQQSDAFSTGESFLLWPFLDGFDYCNPVSALPSFNEMDTVFEGGQEPLSSVSLTPDTMRTAAPISLGSVSNDISSEMHGTFSVSRLDAYMDEQPITEEDMDILTAEDYRYISKPSESTYRTMCALCLESLKDLSEHLRPKLPTLDTLHVCVQLYFEHFHRIFPILHQATFEARSDSWLLYFAVAAVGGQYSRLSYRTKTISNLLRAIRAAFLHRVCINHVGHTSTFMMSNEMQNYSSTVLCHFKTTLNWLKQRYYSIYPSS